VIIMVILDEKTVLPPPPPYSASGPSNPPPFPHGRNYATLIALPSTLLLRVVHELFPQGHPEGQRRILYWLTISLRSVNRALYVASMHVLRSAYLPAYNQLVRAPYTSDPFPGPDPDQPESSSPVKSLQRETHILDLFIALKVREDVWTDESELHLEREESFKDLFDLMQPRSRLEDLVRIYGTRAGVISVSKAKPRGSGTQPIPFSMLSVSFSPRRVGLVMTTKERKRTVVEIARLREETLEVAARQLVNELRIWLAANPHYMTVM